MSMVEAILLGLVLVLTGTAVAAIIILRTVGAQVMRAWKDRHELYLEVLLRREMFEGPPKGQVRESIASLGQSVAALSDISERFTALAVQMQGWRDGPSVCSEREVIRAIAKKLQV